MTHGAASPVAPVLVALQERRSSPRLTDPAPSDAALLPLIAAAARIADHGTLRPWRLISVRDEARTGLGSALASAADLDPTAQGAGLAQKPLRAPLLLALVERQQPSFKVHPWEQSDVIAGIGHVLTLLLEEAGWGVMWRSGPHTRSEAVRRFHGLADNESLHGWLYVGTPAPEAGTADAIARRERAGIDPSAFLTAQ